MFFNKQGWQKIEPISTKNPQKRIKSAGILTENDELIIYGGVEWDTYQDLWVFDLRQAKWEEKATKGERPGNLLGHTCTQYGNKMILFGGMNGKCSNELYELDLKTFEWKKLRKCPYKGRHSQTACLEEETSTIWFFGGYLGKSERSNEMITYNIKKNKWHKYHMYGDVPSPRSSCSAILWKHFIYLFAGYNENVGYYNNLYSFNTQNLTWTEIVKPNAPSPRDRCSCWVDYSQNKMMVFGGMTDDDCFSSLYSFDLDFHFWEDITPYNLINQPKKDKPQSVSSSSFETQKKFQWAPQSGGHVVCSSLRTHYIVLFSGQKKTKNSFDYSNSVYVFQSLPDITQDLLNFAQAPILQDI
ncbi:acyl-coa-binding domain-containing protein [Anaeramoeba ignava]|uniref:Acyl-coa-binding domain-containing protein n=1 Tax=Anaeramoeba ignava TaxID=1746090 RepID=A0A9Q0LBY4_ANAIG|nr:acyl-coa-binding domain-containing protein [Anaeramoeba ignava]